MSEKISLNLTLEELEIIDKCVDLNDDTRQLFDKIRSVYPKSPAEVAYNDWCGEYPPTDPYSTNFNHTFWYAFQKGYNAGVENSNEISKTPVEKQSKTLTDIVYRWWEEVFTTHSDWDMETSVDDLIDQVEQFLPKQKFGSSQNVLGDVDIVEGFNDCLKKIKSKLR